jgi:hypothetical protein
MLDLELAKLALRENNLSLVIVREGHIVFETGVHGIEGFMHAIEKSGKKLAGSSVADRIVGRAAALLCVYAQVAAVFAVTVSKEGVEILTLNDIRYEYENLVPHILNHKKTGICPFEQLTAGLASPEEAYTKLKRQMFVARTDN